MRTHLYGVAPSPPAGCFRATCCKARSLQNGPAPAVCSAYNTCELRGVCPGQRAGLPVPERQQVCLLHALAAPPLQEPIIQCLFRFGAAQLAGCRRMDIAQPVLHVSGVAPVELPAKCSAEPAARFFLCAAISRATSLADLSSRLCAIATSSLACECAVPAERCRWSSAHMCRCVPRRLVRPGNDALCAGAHVAGLPTVCLGSSTADKVCRVTFTGVALDFAACNSSLELPKCDVRALSWRPGVLATAAAAAAGCTSLLVAVSLAIWPAVRRQMARREVVGEEGMQLLTLQPTSSGSGAQPAWRREHADIEQRMRSLRRQLGGAHASERLRVSAAQVDRWPAAPQGTGGRMVNPFSHTSDPLRSAVTFGPLPLRLTDLTFCQSARGSGDSDSGDAGLIVLGAGASSKVGAAPVVVLAFSPLRCFR